MKRLIEMCCCESRNFGKNLSMAGWCRADARGRGAAVIALRLRRPHSHELYSLEHCLSVMWHEITHITHGPHSANFYKLNEELRQHYELIQSKGMVVDASGFPTVGGRSLDDASRNPARSDARTRGLRAAEERRLRQPGAFVLGGASTKPPSPQEAAAAAALRRAQDAAIGLGDDEEAVAAQPSGSVSWNGAWQSVCPVCGPDCVDTRVHARVHRDHDESKQNFCDLTACDDDADSVCDRTDDVQPPPPKRQSLASPELIDLIDDDMPQAAPDTRPPTPTGWDCAACTFVNSLESSACVVCERLRHPPDTTNDAEVARELERRLLQRAARDEIPLPADVTRDAEVALALAREEEAASLVWALAPDVPPLPDTARSLQALQRADTMTAPAFNPFASSLNGIQNFRRDKP